MKPDGALARAPVAVARFGCVVGGLGVEGAVDTRC